MQHGIHTAVPPPYALIIAERARNVRQLLHRELSRDGYATACFANGPDLCQALESNHAPRVILLDPDLPGLADDGVLKRLRQAAQGSILLVHSFGAQTFAPLADIPQTPVKRTGDIEALRAALKTALSTPAPSAM